MFSMNVSLGSRIAPSPWFPTVPPFASRYVSMNSQPSMRSRRTCFWIFGAFRHSPSATTRHAPPRSRFVSSRGRSRWPLISTSSVPSPLIATGQFPAMRAVPSSLGALDVPLRQELLDAGGEILCLRDFHLEGGIETLPSCLGRSPIAVVGARLEGREVAADLLGTDRVRHRASQ